MSKPSGVVQFVTGLLTEQQFRAVCLISSSADVLLGQAGYTSCVERLSFTVWHWWVQQDGHGLA